MQVDRQTEEVREAIGVVLTQWNTVVGLVNDELGADDKKTTQGCG